jgi:glycine reductase
MPKKKVLYYINQFYAGIGGEDKADIGLQEYNHSLGPALGLEKLWHGELEVVKTIACGDNFINSDDNFALLTPRLRNIIMEAQPDVVVAGPAFNAGRYGVACGKFINFVRQEFGIPGVTGMYWENPAVPMYVASNYIITTPETAAGMQKALIPMAAMAVKLARGEQIGPARFEGYLPRGYRYNAWHEKSGAQRTVELLLKKLRNEHYTTEVPLRGFEQVEPAPALANIGTKTIALVTTGALVPKGNPDGLKQAFSIGYGRYSLEGLEALSSTEYESIHGGFDTTLVNDNPSRVVPFSPLNELREEGRIAGIYPWFFTTAGVGTNIKTSEDLGIKIASELLSAGVHAAILTST